MSVFPSGDKIGALTLCWSWYSTIMYSLELSVVEELSKSRAFQHTKLSYQKSPRISSSVPAQVLLFPPPPPFTSHHWLLLNPTSTSRYIPISHKDHTQSAKSQIKQTEWIIISSQPQRHDAATHTQPHDQCISIPIHIPITVSMSISITSTAILLPTQQKSSPSAVSAQFLTSGWP